FLMMLGTPHVGRGRRSTCGVPSIIKNGATGADGGVAWTANDVAAALCRRDLLRGVEGAPHRLQQEPALERFADERRAFVEQAVVRDRLGTIPGHVDHADSRALPAYLP